MIFAVRQKLNWQLIYLQIAPVELCKHVPVHEQKRVPVLFHVSPA